MGGQEDHDHDQEQTPILGIFPSSSSDLDHDSYDVVKRTGN